ncbi:MAG TPA: glycosyltransferase [Solirubrobacteraceae bacterium]|nr:glycosyltransferase [Solirubrobacteraceae bacterium]
MGLRIAIDARLAWRGLGIATYVEELTRALAERADVEEVVLVGSTRGAAARGPKIRSAHAAVPAALLHTSIGGRVLARLGVDVVHFAGNVGPARSYVVPHVLTVHDAIFLDAPGATLRQRLGRAYLRRVVPRAAAAAPVVVAVSPTGADDARRLGARAAAIRVIPHGVPRRRPAAGPTGRHVLLFAARDPRKGTAVALRAWANAVERLPADVELVVLCAAGLGTSEAALASATPHVRRVGRLSRSDLDDLVGAALALVHTSTAEGFGLPVLEAITAGVPVVGGYAPSVRWIAADALLATEPGDDRALADALVRLIRDDSLRADLALRGRRRAAEFSWERSAAAHVAAYRAALAAPPTP